MKTGRALALYRTMARIRAFENAAEEASKGGVSAFGAALSNDVRVRGPLHLSTGQEAVPAGVCINLSNGDLITSTHRGHGHTLAKGASMEKMMCELFGRATGFNGGKGGSMHIADFSVGMLGANGVVAAGIPIAVGAAHALKVQSKENVVACFFGDGAINRGQTDIEALYAASPQPTLQETTGNGRYLLFRVGDCVSMHNIHAAIYDSLRLCKDF